MKTYLSMSSLIRFYFWACLLHSDLLHSQAGHQPYFPDNRSGLKLTKLMLFDLFKFPILWPKFCSPTRIRMRDVGKIALERPPPPRPLQ